MILAQISDTHIMASDNPDDRRAGRIEALRRCVADINGLDTRPDVVIHTGDMTQDGKPSEFVAARDVLADLEMPYYPTPGNRDGSLPMVEAFKGLSEKADFMLYAVEEGAVRLIAMDSLSNTGNKGDFTPEQLAALDALLATAPDQPTAIFMHHPPFDVTTAIDPFQYYRREAATEFEAVVARHPQLIRLFCGHSHRDYRADVGTMLASTMPSVAIELRQGTYPDDKSNDPVYHLHRYIDGAGFETETRWVPPTAAN